MAPAADNVSSTEPAATKLSPSPAPCLLVARPRLLAQLDAIPGQRLGLLVAPAGFGKSIVLAQWYQRLTDTNRARAAWLTLDHHDAEPTVFVRNLLAACARGGLVGKSGVDVLDAPTGVPPHLQLTALINALDGAGAPAVLILDDWQAVAGTAIDGLAGWLVSRLPRQTGLVIAGRERPRIGAAGLQARGEALVIDATPLRFSVQETETLLGGATAAARELHARCEGWPIAIGMGARGVGDGGAACCTRAPSREQLSALLAEEVLATVPETLRATLPAMGLIERFNSHLLDALVGDGLGLDIIEALRSRELFLVRLDDEGRWYRFDHLFREFLRERAAALGKNQVKALHHRAAHWFQAQGLLAEALEHALLAGDRHELAAWAEDAGGWRFGLAGHMEVLQRVLDALDPEQVERHPRLWLGEIYVLAKHGDIPTASARYARLQAQLGVYHGDDAPLARRVLDGEIAIIGCLLGRYADLPADESAVRTLETMAQNAPPGEHVLHATRCNLLSALYLELGRLEEAVRIGERAISAYRAMGSAYGENFIYYHQGRACLAQGRLRDAEVLYLEGERTALKCFGPGSDLSAIAAAYLAETTYQRNDLDAAARYAEIALPHIERFDSWADVFVAAYMTRANLLRLSEGLPEALACIDRAISTALFRNLPRLRMMAELHRLQLYLHSGQPQLAITSAQSLALDSVAADPKTQPRLRHAVELCRARMELAIEDASSAATRLQTLRAKLLGEGRIRCAMEAEIVLASALATLGEQKEAVAVLDHTLVRAMFQGWRRVFIDEGEALLPLLRRCLQDGHGDRRNALRDRFVLELLGAMDHDREARLPVEPSPLTARERELLLLLGQGLSNKEIASDTGLTTNTVKFHLKNLYAKLGVGSRRTAVREALRRGLVP